MEEVAIVIPVYKEDMDKHEKMSFCRALEVFVDYPLFLVGPKGINYRNYHKLKKLHIFYFDDKYFKGISGYNRLMLSLDFYKTCLDYRYILIYQLDAFIFDNTILDWCVLGYDYIGAPWLNTNTNCSLSVIKNIPFWKIHSMFFLGLQKIARIRGNYTGNGGLSLRRVDTFMKILALAEKMADKWSENEDRFWSFVAPYYYRKFKIAPAEYSIKFSFEVNPAYCYRLNNYNLPFGCHAWPKNDINFWRPIFKKYGHDI